MWLTVKSLGVTLHQCLSYDLHVTALSQRCNQLSKYQLYIVLVGLITSRLLLYALPGREVFVSVGQCGRMTDAFLKCAHKWSFSKDTITFSELLIKSGSS